MITADIILVILAFIGLTISSIVDIKKREIPNWTNFSMVAAALAIRLMHSTLTQEWYYFLYGLLGFAIMLAIGNLMYYTKQWGGGDSKLLFAIGAIFATKPYFVKDFKLPFLVTFFLAILMTGAVYSLVYSLVLAIQNRKKFWKELKYLNNKHRTLRTVVVFFAFIVAAMGFSIISTASTPILIFAAVLIISVYWIMFAKAIEASCLIKSIPVSKLTEGDWILDEKIIKKYKIPKTGIELKQIKALKKSNIKKITIKEGIPFAPAFLITLIIILLI